MKFKKWLLLPASGLGAAVTFTSFVSAEASKAGVTETTRTLIKHSVTNLIGNSEAVMNAYEKAVTDFQSLYDLDLNTEAPKYAKQLFNQTKNHLLSSVNSNTTEQDFAYFVTILYQLSFQTSDAYAKTYEISRLSKLIKYYKDEAEKENAEESKKAQYAIIKSILKAKESEFVEKRAADKKANEAKNAELQQKYASLMAELYNPSTTAERIQTIMQQELRAVAEEMAKNQWQEKTFVLDYYDALIQHLSGNWDLQRQDVKAKESEIEKLKEDVEKARQELIDQRDKDAEEKAALQAQIDELTRDLTNLRLTNVDNGDLVDKMNDILRRVNLGKWFITNKETLIEYHGNVESALAELQKEKKELEKQVASLTAEKEKLEEENLRLQKENRYIEAKALRYRAGLIASTILGLLLLLILLILLIRRFRNKEEEKQA